MPVRLFNEPFAKAKAHLTQLCHINVTEFLASQPQTSVMRKFSLLLLSLGLSSFLFAQKVSGIVKDEKGKPVNGSTVSLLIAKDSSVFKYAATKEDGRYQFSNIKEGSYLVAVTHVGHAASYSGVWSTNGGDTQVPEIVLGKLSGDMKGVTVTAKKPMVEVKADKTILNVEGTINAVGNDALELLRKAPGVLVDKDDNLSLSGKNGVQVYIDGRPTPLAGKDLSDYLKSMQSSQVEAIEIITNPSAKYDAAGNAGIINIRLKKNKSFGTNGSVNAGWNIGTFPKYNTGFSLNHRNQNINLFGNYNFNKSHNRNFFNMYREAINDSLFEQLSIMDHNNLTHGFKVGMDYFINRKNTIGVIVNGNIADVTFKNDGETLISYIPSKTPDKLLVANNRNDMERDNMNFNLNYRFADTTGKELNIDADHGFYNIHSDQYQPNFTYNTTRTVLLNKEIYQMLAPSEIKIYTLKSDYEQNFKKGRLGVGAKLSYVTSDNNFDRFNILDNGKKMEHNNNFNYEENINAVYLNYNRQLKSVMIQAGLRVENTNAKGHSKGSRWEDATNNYIAFDSTLDRNYTDFFPSAAITFNKNPMNQWNFTYSRRIDRPVYQDLNPFEFRLDKYAFMRGNTELRPQYTNSIAVTNTYKYKLNTTLNYSHVADVFSQLVDVDKLDSSKSFMTKKNLATQDIISLNVSYPFSYKNFSSFVNVNSYYSHFKADNGPNRKVDVDVFAATVYSQNSLKFAKTWTAELSGWFSSPSIWQGTFKSKAMGGVDVGMQKQLLSGKATIKASVSDVFKTMQWSSTSDYAGQYMKVWGGWESRQFKLNLSYRFGNNQVKAARQRKTGLEDENKRVQSAGGGGIGQ